MLRETKVRSKGAKTLFEEPLKLVQGRTKLGKLDIFFFRKKPVW